MKLNPEFDWPTAHLAVLYLDLPIDGRINEDDPRLTAIRSREIALPAMSPLYMDSSVFASALGSDVRRGCIFGFSVETLSPSPQCMRTPAPLWVDGLDGLKADQVSPGRISSI